MPIRFERSERKNEDLFSGSSEMMEIVSSVCQFWVRILSTEGSWGMVGTKELDEEGPKLCFDSEVKVIRKFSGRSSLLNLYRDFWQPKASSKKNPI